eukprot:g19173.t1
MGKRYWQLPGCSAALHSYASSYLRSGKPKRSVILDFLFGVHGFAAVKLLHSIAMTMRCGAVSLSDLKERGFFGASEKERDCGQQKGSLEQYHLVRIIDITYRASLRCCGRPSSLCEERKIVVTCLQA